MRRAFWTHLLLLTLISLVSGIAKAQDDVKIYTDNLADGWANWSWAKVDMASQEMVHSGRTAIKVNCSTPKSGFYLHTGPINTSLYTHLTFWIHGGQTGGQKLTISGVINNDGKAKIPLDNIVGGGITRKWKYVSIALSELGLGATKEMTGFWIQDGTSQGQPTFYIDDITLVGKHLPPPLMTVQIDFKAGRHPISPLIYGVAFAKKEQLVELNSPLNRWGGNATTRYNWEQNASNRAADWFFESIADEGKQSSASADRFVESTFAAKAQPMITIPTLGWVASLGPKRSKTWSFSQKKYGDQQYAEGDAGNGVNKSGEIVTGNDPNDANVPADSLFQQFWVKHFVRNYKSAKEGGLQFYILDNEPALWGNTHRDVHPVSPKMEEVYNKITDYAAKIREVDPDARIVAPEEWGWSGYLYSGYDMQWGAKHGFTDLPDRKAHGNQDMMPWLLAQLRQYDKRTGKRSIDVFSLHYYPQGGEYGNDTSAAMQLRRNRSTRSLWDPQYIDESWIKDKVQLIPRMKRWVKENYPGLAVGITEYNWGAENHINGATTQADIYGIFGREGLDIGTRWTTPDAKSPTFKAMQMYRNVDGNNNGFGDISVSDIVPDPDTLSSFAAVRTSDGAQTIMLINKVARETPVVVKLANCRVKGATQAWRLTSTNTITKLPDTSLPAATKTGINWKLTLPAQSITLYVIPSK